jgi:hypothetical protein
MRRFVVALGAVVTAIAVLLGPSSGAVAAKPSGVHGPSRSAHPAPPDGPGPYPSASAPSR